jgi:hypothetical protein
MSIMAIEGISVRGIERDREGIEVYSEIWSFCTVIHREDKSEATNYSVTSLKYSSLIVPHHIVKPCHLSPMMCQDESVNKW